MAHFKPLGVQIEHDIRELQLKFLKLESRQQPVGLFLKKGIFAKIFSHALIFKRVQ